MNRILVAMFGFLVTTLLLGSHLGWAWAGGDELAPQQRVGVTQVAGHVTADRVGAFRDLETGDALRRGEVIRTDQGSRAVIQLGFANELFMDENTDVRLDNLSVDGWRIHLIRGRIYINTHTTDTRNVQAFGDVTVSTNYTESNIQAGTLSIVNYDFKETVGIIPFDSIVATIIGEDAGYILQEPVEIHETDPVDVKEVYFNINTSAAKEFYEWAIGDAAATQ